MEKSKFDTNYTLRYKYAKAFGIPVKYVLYKDGEYFSMIEYINEKLQEEFSILQILEEINSYMDNISFLDFMMLYYYIASQYENTPEEILKDINNVIEQINLDDENLYGKYSKNDEEIDKFDDEAELQGEFERWESSYIQELANDEKKLQKILDSQKILEETTPEMITPPIIEELILEFKPKLLDGNNATYEDGVGIFNDMIPSFNVPYIQYNDNSGRQYYKVYEDQAINFDNVIPSIDATRKSQHIYFVISLIEDIKDLETDSDSVKKNYKLCKYDLSRNRNRLTIRTPEKNKSLIIERMIQTFQNIELGPYKEIDLKADFSIPNTIIDFPAFHFLVFNDENEDLELNSVFSSYIFIDELKNSTVNRDNLNIKFKSLEDNEEEEEEEVPEEYASYAELQVPSSLTLIITKKENHYSFRAIKVKNMETFKEFLEIFSHLISIYKNYKESIYDQLYLQVLPELAEKQEEVLVQEVTTDKLGNLRKADPEIFKKDSNGYARLCSCERQPLIIDDDEEAADWKNKSLADEKYRVIGNFPPKKEETKVRYVCPDDEYPYPGLIKSNVGEYPYIPCCAKNFSSEEKLISEYDSQGKKIVNKTYKINTIKVLDWKRDGNIPLPIQTLLSSFSADEKYEFGRIGVGRSYNSLIHCIMIALGQTNDDSTVYENLENYTQREAYCETIRQKMLTSFPDLAVYAQETFDIEPEEVIRILKDNKEFLDPAIFYRGLEELYDINIFVFKPEDNKLDEPSIEIPRHKFSHIRPEKLERRSVVILKHNGGESEDLKFPQCELIINTGKIKGEEEKETVEEKEERKGRGRPKKEQKEQKINMEKPQYDFGEDITTILFNSLEKYNKNYIFTFDEKTKVTSRLNPYSKVRYDDIFSYPIELISQGIDNYGKTRSFNFKIAQFELTAFVPPTQPLNLPLSKGEVYVIHDPKVVETIFGVPKKITNEGYWYSIIDYEHGLFIPCNATGEAPVHYLNRDNKENPILQYRNTKKYYDMFIDLVIWGLRSNKILNLKDYDKIPKFVQIVKSLDYSVKPVFRIDHRLPENQNFTYLHDLWPNYFTNNNKVKMTQSLYDKVMVYLKRYYIETDGLSLPPSKYLQGVFEYEWDFTQFMNSRVIIDSEKLDNWRKQRKRGVSSEVQIYKTLTRESLYRQEEPYLYLNEQNNKVFIIQNIRGGKKAKALFVAQKWKESRFNSGYNISDEDISDFDENVETLIYIIDPSGKLIPSRQENIKVKSEKYLQILYINGLYSAILPLM